MLELVFVIVVIGILAAAIIPRMDKDTLYEATEQVMGHIKYTQHLAMTDNVYDDDNQYWYNERWKIDFRTPNIYTISQGNSAVANGFLSATNIAVDPFTKADIDGTNDYNLDEKYDVTFPAGSVLAFDHLGRPYATTGQPSSATDDLLKIDYNITLTSGGDTATITVTAETGYTFITYN